LEKGPLRPRSSSPKAPKRQPGFTTKSRRHEDARRQRHDGLIHRRETPRGTEDNGTTDLLTTEDTEGTEQGATASRSWDLTVSGGGCHTGSVPTVYTDFTDSCVHGSRGITRIILEGTIMTTAGIHHEDTKAPRSTKTTAQRIEGPQRHGGTETTARRIDSPPNAPRNAEGTESGQPDIPS